MADPIEIVRRCLLAYVDSDREAPHVVQGKKDFTSPLDAGSVRIDGQLSAQAGRETGSQSASLNL